MDAIEKLQEASWSPTVDVFIIVNYSKILDIDTLNQRFNAEIIIEAIWHDPGIKSLTDTIDEKKIWTPDLYVENGISNIKEEVVYKVILHRSRDNTEDEPKLMICELRKVMGMFYENLELEDFPLDVQDLSVTVATKKPGAIINFIRMQEEKKVLKISNTLDKSMWKMHHLLLTKKKKICREYSFGLREYPAIQVSAKVFRLSGFFFWNAALPIFLITLASLTPFSVEITMQPSRLATTSTLIFTCVSMRWTVSFYKPTVSYLTSIDKYSIATLFIITIELMYHAIMGAVLSKLPSVDVAKFLDKMFLIFFCILIIMKELVFFLWYRQANLYRRNVSLDKIVKLNDEETTKRNYCWEMGFLKIWRTKDDQDIELKEPMVLHRRNFIERV